MLKKRKVPTILTKNSGTLAAYVLNDEFTTDLSAGNVDNTLAEPGPGLRNVIDTNNKLSIVSGVLSFATGGVGNSDPSVQYGPYRRYTGRILYAAITPSVSTISIGWDENEGGTITDAFRFLVSSGRLDIRDNTFAVAVGTFSGGTTYEVAIILRETGSFFFIKGGAFTHWTLMFIVETEGTSPMYPTISVEGSATVATADNVKIQTFYFAPVPLISDGFSIDGESDGLGHLEGVLQTAYGQGGDGISWVSNLGEWTVADGKLVLVAVDNVIPVGILLADCGKTDVIVDVAIYDIAGGATSIIVRWVDVANHIVIRHTGTHIQFIKVVGGSTTVLINTATTYVDGAVMRLIVQGTKFRCFYNGAAIGAEQTVSDAALQSSTTVGLIADDTDTRFDNFVVFARGTSGEYDTVLDSI